MGRPVSAEGENHRGDAEVATASETEGGGGVSPDAEVRPEVEVAAADEPSAEPAPTNGAAAETPADGPDAEALKQESELESLLGPDVRTPVGIPKDYRPLDASLTPMFRVELDDFTGPLDLLLFLIRRHEIDVFDIPITFITDRYIEMVDALQALEIDVAAEFLVLAADLVHIKSKMLLPAKEGEPVDDDPEPEIDPREELVRRLLEYQKYRDAAEQLGDRDQLGRDVFARVPPNLDAVDDLDPGLKSISIFKLVEVMARMMKKTPKVSHAIEFETYSISERIHFIMGYGESQPDERFTLVEMMASIRTRPELVVTFIAVLEMTKLGLAKVLVDEANLVHAPVVAARTVEDNRPHPEDARVVEPPDPAAIEAALAEAHEVEGTQPPQRATATPSAAGEDEEPLEVPPLAEDEAPTPTQRPQGAPTEADGALQETLRLAQELEDLEASMAAEEAEELAREQARLQALADRDENQPWAEDPLPTIWVQLTGKKFEGDILDDYL